MTKNPNIAKYEEGKEQDSEYLNLSRWEESSRRWLVWWKALRLILLWRKHLSLQSPGKMFHYFQWFGSRWLWLCKTISSQVGQCAQVLWRPLALRRLDQPRRSGSWSCALPCLHHPGWVAPRGSPEGEKVVVFLLQPWSSLKSEPAQWNTPGLPLPCQSADGDKECCCSIVVAKNDPDPFVQMEEVEVVAAYRDRLLALPCVRDTSYPR